MVDVFAETSYTGNPLAVIVSEQPLPCEVMQKIAAEMNFSETTFVNSVPDDDGGYRVRIFTPAREIAFTGHPILGTAWVIRHYLVGERNQQLRLNLAVGTVVVSFETSTNGKDIVWFVAPSMSLGAISNVDLIATALGLAVNDIDVIAPVQVVSAGTSAIMVPLCSLEALRRSKLDLDAFTPLENAGFPPLVYLFCKQTHKSENDLCVRFFFEAYGVREDPATGNGAAFLGAYLLAHHYFGGAALSLKIEQGHEVRRPSLIRLRAQMQKDNFEVKVGGYVVPTIQGELL